MVSPHLVSSVLAETAVRIVANCFDAVSGEERRCFRVKNLTPSETVVKFLNIWKESATQLGYENVRLVVAGDTDLQVPPEYKADPDKSITYYRNNNSDGLIYVETKVQSDEQGLKNLFTLKDSNFLDNSFNGENFLTKEEIVRAAWRVLDKEGNNFPVLVSKRIIEVLDHLHPGYASIPVRKFILFALSALEEWDEIRAEHGNVDPSATEALIGRNLVHLDMFPDEVWCLAPADSRTARRLFLNSLHADMSSSATAELDPEKLAERCYRTKFRDEDGVEYEASEMSRWRGLCANFCHTQNRQIRQEIPYRIFEQLFAPDSVGLKLGERVSQEIEALAPERLHEFDGLNVKAGLDRRSQDDAIRFLEADPDDSALVALRALLSNQTRRMVEKVAFPANERFFNPMSKLAEVSSALVSRAGRDGEPSTIEIDLVDQKTANNPSIGLFAFLFGKSLHAVCRLSADSPFGVELKVNQSLMDVCSPPSLPDQDEDDEPIEEDENAGIFWEPVPIVFRLLSSDGTELDSESGLEWYPDNIEHLAAAWLLLVDEDSPLYEMKLGLSSSSSYGEWAELASRRLTPVDTLSVEEFAEKSLTDPVFGEARRIGISLKQKARTEGLSPELAFDQFDAWLGALDLAKSEFVPDGDVDDRLDSFLSLDSVFVGAENSAVVLPSHPLKLRWIGHYLKKSEELAIKSLAGELPLNTKNERLYLDWFSSLTPHKHPVLAIDRRSHLLSAARETAWHDYFRPLDVAVGDGTLDNLSLFEVVRQLESYMEAHPHKRDGLSILILCPHMIDLPAMLLKEFRRGDWKDVVVTVHVIAPREEWEKLTDQFEELTTESRMNAGRALFPPVQLRFYEGVADRSLQDLVDDQVFDIGVVPNFLHDKISVQFNTDPPSDIEGHFDPLLDRPTNVRGGAGSGSISVEMRPRNQDVAMSGWSTLCVRSRLGRPVSPTQRENEDFANLRIDFNEASRLFAQIHDKCHWVITVEEHITREQIERLEGGPDILSVKEGVGAGGLYTLIVSSNSGRKFIVERLDRKLRKFIPKTDLAGRNDSVIHGLAEHVYEETRNIAPRLALQAMGISRVTEEILGLSIAKTVAESEFPASPREGFVGWVSLDDHLEWFSGPSGTRADLARFSFEIVDGAVQVDLLVVEGKLRQQFDPHGIAQVEATMELLEDAVRERDDDEIAAEDMGLWREKFLSALETSSQNARSIFGREDHDGTKLVPLDIRHAFRAGNYRLRSLKGLYSICRYDETNPTKKENVGEVCVVHKYRNHILSLIESTEMGGEASAGLSDASSQVDNVLEEPSAENGAQHGGADEEESDVGPESEPNAGALTSKKEGKLTHEELENRYQMILDKFGEFNVSVNAPPNIEDRFIEGPASVLYRVLPGAGTSPGKLSSQADVLKLALQLGEEQNLRFGIDKGFVTIDVPKSERERYFVAAEDLWEHWAPSDQELCVPIGVDRYGASVSLNFSSSNTPHLLIGGTTGSGKSEALNTILYGLVNFYSENDLKLHLIDPKGTELQAFDDHPSLGSLIGWDEQDTVEILAKCVDEMQVRYTTFKAAKKRSLPEYNASVDAEARLPWWLVVLDEYADLTSDQDAKKQIEEQLKRLAQKARAAGIHVIIATQNPKADVISTNLRSNLPAQLALRVKSGTESRVIMDEPGAESLNGMGDAFLKTAKGIVRVQCAKVSS